MEYRVTIKSNPRLLMLFAIIGALAAGSILLTIFWTPIGGIIAMGIVFYIDYHLIKFARLQLSSYVTTTSDGIRGLSTVSETIFIPWESISHAGVAREPGGRRSAFVYSEEADQLITVPSDYENFDGFVEELEGRADLMDIALEGTQSVADRLRELVVADEEEVALPVDEKTEPEPDSDDT